ncbi:MAG: hypothetical protein J6K32_11195 [Clostridia bacterium]|nr:hypothetical protein [Clostridia bacterium]
MAGMAYQQAPGGAKQNGPRMQQSSRPAGAEQKTGLMGKLQAIGQGTGVAIMVVMLALALLVGNFRALQNATPKAFLRQGDVASIIEDRADAAGNALTVARRAGLDETIYQSVEKAVEELEKANTAKEISRADQDLTAAVSGMIADAGNKLDGENKKMLTRAADDFSEQGSFLRQEARSYNRDAEKAEALYEKLPLKFLFAQPDVYEGI